jgi:choline dehydrogenase
LNEYDFIIVGAGSAGSALASRLSEDEKYSVLVLEAGRSEMLLSDLPMMATFLQSTEYNWGYKTEPSSGNCLGMKDQKCACPKGKAIGGSSVINYMIYTRGHTLDWDRIAAAGNPGW